MSLETWMKEFYPMSAVDCAKSDSDYDSLVHSLKKWRGLRKEVLKAHRVKVDECGTLEDYASEKGTDFLSIDFSTCACCEMAERRCFKELHEPNNICLNCPIKQLTGDTCGRAYAEWCGRKHDPEPMIQLLELAFSKCLDTLAQPNKE